MKNKNKITTRSRQSLILIFLAAIWIPVLGYIANKSGDDNLGEKRILAEIPELSFENLKFIPSQFEAYYQDRFGLRALMIKGHNYIRYKLLKGSSVGKVLIGENDWLYLTEKETIPDFLGHKQTSQEELADWKQHFQTYQEFLNSRGIYMLVVVAPNKSTIYPEYLPKHIYSSAGQTRLDRINEYLGRYGSIPFLDIRLALLEAKKTRLVYHPRDTHWNHHGAFVAYTEIIKHLQKKFGGLEPMRLEDFNIKQQVITGDLSIMLGLQETLAEQSEILEPKKPFNSKKTELILPADYPWPRHIRPDKQTALENPQAQLKCILFHDSFGYHGGFKEYLAEHFRKLSCVPLFPDFDCLRIMVEQEKPDVVIIQVVERNLANPAEN